MAATASRAVYTSGQGGPAIVTRMDLSVLVSGQLETLSHLGPSGQAPDEIYFHVTTRPNAGSGVCMSYEGANTTNNTADVRFTASDQLGSLTGAVIRVFFKFYNAA